MANPASDAGESKFTADVNRISSGRNDRLLLRLSNGGRNLPRYVSLPEGSGNSRAGGSGNISMQQYPPPDSEKDCVFFLSTGFCRYRQHCRFKHPTPENTQVEMEGTNGNASESQPEKSSPIIPCKFFRAGFCQNGGCCSFVHSIPEYQQVNISGLPIRSGVPDCSYYLRNGFCGYGLACKFNHPEGGEDIVYYQNASPGASNGGYFTQFPESTHAFYPQDPMIDSSYQVTQPTFSWTDPQSQQLSDGTHEMTSYYVANADTFYFRPKKPSVKIAPLMLNDAGFPLRPGKSVCWHYEKSGHCTYGRACIFHHPQKLSSNVDEASPSKSGSDAKTPETEE